MFGIIPFCIPEGGDRPEGCGLIVIVLYCNTLDSRGITGPPYTPSPGYIDESINEGFVFPDYHHGTFPLYEYQNLITLGSDYYAPGISFYYTTLLDKAGMYSKGYWFSGVTAYVYRDNPTPPPGTVPLYRYHNPTTDDYFYTIIKDDYKLRYVYGYIPDGHDGYVFAKQVPGSVPLLRFLIDGRHHFYSIHPTEVAQFAHPSSILLLKLIG